MKHYTLLILIFFACNKNEELPSPQVNEVNDTTTTVLNHILIEKTYYFENGDSLFLPEKEFEIDTFISVGGFNLMAITDTIYGSLISYEEVIGSYSVPDDAKAITNYFTDSSTVGIPATLGVVETIESNDSTVSGTFNVSRLISRSGITFKMKGSFINVKY